MNNLKIIQDSHEKSSEGKHMTEVALSNSEQVLGAIKGLKDSEDYFSFKRLVLDPAIESTQKRMERNLKDLMEKPILEREILRDQGILIAFKKFADLDELEKIYSKEVERLTTILRK